MKRIDRSFLRGRLVRGVGAAILIALVAAVVRFFLPVPYSPTAIARLIPAEVRTFVTIRDIRGMLDRIRSTRAFQRACEAPESGEPLREIPDWLIDLIGEECAFAIWRPDPQRRPVLLLLGWVGRRSRHLDPLAHGIQKLPDSEYRLKDRRYDGKRVTRIFWEEFPPGSVADYTVMNGVVLFALAWEEGAIETLIDRASRDARSLAEDPAWTTARDFAREDPDACGYGFVRSPEAPDSIARFRLMEKGGTIRADLTIPAADPEPRPRRIEPDDPLFRSLPADALAVGWGDTAWLKQATGWFTRRIRDWGGRIPRDFDAWRFPDWTGDYVVACLPRWEPISDRLPVELPQLILGGDLRSARGAMTRFRGWVDDLARRTGWRLRATPCKGIALPSLCVESDDPRVRDDLGIRELPAAVFPPGQWRFGTRRSTLLQAAVRGEPLAENLRHRFRNCEAGFWLDPAAAADSAELGLSIYGVLRFWLRSIGRDLAFEIPPEEALPWIDAARCVRELTLTGSRRQGRIGLHLRLRTADVGTPQRER